MIRTGVVAEIELPVTHTKLATGFALTEVDHYVTTFDAADLQFEEAGNLWDLRDVDGKQVLGASGRW